MNYGFIAYGSIDELERLQQLMWENTRYLDERDEPQRADFEDNRTFHEAHIQWERKPKRVYETMTGRRLYLGKKKED